MKSLRPIDNPFAMMIHPEAVLAALASSERLARLESRVCRPLDKPMLNPVDTEIAAFDERVEDAAQSQRVE
jgi:hypothetical protein